MDPLRAQLWLGSSYTVSRKTVAVQCFFLEGGILEKGQTKDGTIDTIRHVHRSRRSEQRGREMRGAVGYRLSMGHRCRRQKIIQTKQHTYLL